MNIGLFISLDGVNFSDTVEISYDSIINDIKTNYPTNTNQWASGGLWPASSNGIKTSIFCMLFNIFAKIKMIIR